MLLSLLVLSGCVAEKTITIDRNADWVKLGPDVKGHYYLRVNGVWTLQKSVLQFPESWIAGPEPK